MCAEGGTIEGVDCDRRRHRTADVRARIVPQQKQVEEKTRIQRHVLRVIFSKSRYTFYSKREKSLI